MKITDLINKAMSILKEQGHPSSTLATICSSSFKPILVFYNDRDVIYYNAFLHTELNNHIQYQLQKGSITKGTFNKRHRGPSIIEEVCRIMKQNL